MNSVSRKATLVVGAMAAAVGLSMFGAGTASASPLLPYQGTVYSSLGKCLTVGNTLAQKGAITTFTCQPRGKDGYAFYYTT
ncbi:hypothetical protein ACH4S9_23180 [Streptomyces sp. NPDC021225]|uniref:hypothetical protein n=1 Tax=Streptomyces sp. NPDC021225 TaxID=3365121 RepID=UPI0037A3F6C9